MNFAIYKNKNFKLLTIARVISVFGDVFLTVALALYVLEITGSAGKFASIMALSIIPQLLLGFFSGAIVDRIEKKKTLVLLDLIRGIYLIASLIFINNSSNLAIIYITIIIFSVCEIFFGPCSIVVLTSILKDEELVKGNATLNTLVESVKVIATVITPIIYGIYGLKVVLIIDSLTFFISALCVVFMKFHITKNVVRKVKFIKDVKDGIKVFFIDRRIVSLVFNGVLTHMFLFPFFFIGIPYILITLLKQPKVSYGIVEATGTFALIISSAIVSITKNKLDISKNINLGIIGMLLSVLLFMPLGNTEFILRLKNSNILSVCYFSLANFVMFLSFGFYLVFFVTFYQRTIPKEFLGRFGATMMLFFSLGRLLGYNMYGFLFNLKNLIFAVMILGVGMVFKLIVHIPFLKKEKVLCTQQLKSNS